MRLHKKRIRWGKILLAFLVAFGAAVGLLKGGLTSAFEGDDWTTTYDGLSITVVSVEQNGVSLAPQDDGEGGHYFNVANNTDTVRVGSRIEGMEQGETYYYYPTSPWWMDNRIDLTYEDNGIVIYQELEPEISFDDNYYLSGVYHVEASISREQGYGVQKNIVVRPTSIGSHSIDIVSVKQGNTDLTLSNNEYQITDYSTPVEVTYKFKNLENGKYYSAGIGYDDWYEFRAEGTQTAETTRELALDLKNNHTATYIYLQGSEAEERVELYFKVADSDFNQLGDIIIDEIEQGGVVLVPEADTSGWEREYTFSANDAQGLTVRMHTTRATEDINYYIFYSIYGSGYGGGYSSEEPLMVTGDDFERAGVVLTIPAPYGLSESSPLTLSFDVYTTETSMHDYDDVRNVVYKNYANPQNTSDAFKLNVEVNENVPRYEAGLFYSDGTRIESERISPALHDDEHPLLLEVRGERYDDLATYNIETKVMVNGETTPFYTGSFTATGAELNEGTVFTLSDLALELPEFDPSGETSGYDLFYEFSLSIDGLRQSGEMLYVYEGWINPSITFNDGEVIAMGSGGGIGGDVYSTINGTTARKSAFSGSRGAVINYFMGAFDDILSYDYTLYYNDNAGENWWSESAGTVIASDTVTGEELNNNGLTVNIATPSNESEGVMYTLVITRGGKVVRLARDCIVFTDEPMIESFKFTADSDSFMQIERSAYRVASGTDIMATLTGNGFEDEAEYRLWVSFEGYRYDEESEYSYPQHVDLTSLNTSVVMTGAELNAGYDYALNYLEAFNNVNFLEVGFAVSDRDADEPTWYGATGNGSYSGHGIHIDYVNDDEVFRDNGYQVNDDGTITNVSQPDDPHGPDEPIPVDIRTPEGIDVIVEGGTITVVSEKPVTAVGFRNGEWVKLYEWDVAINGEERTNHYSIGDCSEAKVVLKGDGDMDGEISTNDSTFINRSLISPTLPPYRELSDLERILFNVDDDNEISTNDSTLINRSLISPTLPPYHEIEW